ncbi:putative disease resistance RPP13-like protein 1 [Corylus avellana]|uniref:putative disease resistance RPP13-like protein 1 n=1 Tax=Corylus avellana TaxID=13451 RepID=UPI00286B76ED|nr:putative disease resistance RPP13-like protein 1 [Corylus avellana]
MADALLSVGFHVLIDRMSREVLDFFGGRKLAEGPLRKLKIALLSVKAVVEDAEEKELTNPDVKVWLCELKDAAFEAEDILGEIATEILRCKLGAEFQTTARKPAIAWTTTLFAEPLYC